MKRFTSFLCSLLLAVFAMAQGETKSFTVNPTEGSFIKTDGTTVTSGYAYKWISATENYPEVTISVAKDGTFKNNIDAAVTTGFSMWVGTGYSTYTFSVADCQILSYSLKFKSNATGNHVTVTPTGGEAVTSTDEEQTLTVSDVNASSASIKLSGSNYAILVTELTFTVMTSPFTTGSVYHFQNIGNTAVALDASALTDVAAVTSDKESTTQQWYCEKVDGYYTFRNLSNGKYLKGNGASGSWSLTDDYSDGANKFIVVYPETQTNDDASTTTHEGYTIYSTSHSKGSSGGGGSMHRDGGNNIVGWGSYNSNTRWTITTVDYTEEQLAANWERVKEFAPNAETVTKYEEALEAIFTDVACTTLKSAYTSANMTDEALEADENYSALPQTLRDMVNKVRGGNWAEETVALDARPNGNNSSHGQWDVYTTWNDAYARKFRVQMYEPYSVEGEITSYLRFNAHCNMDNPTGIYANSNQAIYIMVEGTIEEGSELWLAHQTGHGVTSYYNNSAYTELHEGLNVVPYFTDGCQMWINYVVHTYNGSGTDIATKFPHKLSDYKPLKIHIEGGYINGFFNAMGDFRSTEVSGDANGGENLWGEVDNDADWDYYKARAALDSDFALLGHRQTLLFPFGAWDSTNGYFGVANDGGGIEKALAHWLENIEVPTTPNCYGGSGNTFGDYSDTYYPGMNLDAETGKINIMLEAWDRIMYSEHATMGLLSKSNIDKMNSLYPRWTNEGTTAEIYNYGEATVNGITETYKEFCQGIDYSDYYNHHGTALGSASGYMSGGWRVCNYHYNTMGSIIGKIANEAGPTWGPAHEIGHQHQGVFNLNGQTEVTNNFFSNVAVWYMGMGTSRVNGNNGSLNNLLSLFNNEDVNQYLHMTQGGNIWALTHLYYRLWLYYHLAGNNTQFWPRLFELCRQTPLENGTQISGETSLLRFYQHACDAAGEDLTEFFRAHGYFDVMDNVYVGDYTNATYNMTEEQIETAITAVEANNYPKNYAILLINDGTSDTTVKHDGTSKRALWDGSASAEYGSVNDFIEGNTSITTAYDATVSADGTVTMSGGEGGVGFLVFNEDGELVSFSNKSSFQLSDEAVYLLVTGQATIKTIDAENNTTDAAVVDLTALQSESLETLVGTVKSLLALVDDTYTKVGYYKPSAVEDLQAAFATAKSTLETGSGIAAAYELLYTEYRKVIENEDARIAIVPGLKYAIKSKSGNDYMDVADDGSNVKTTGSATFPTDDSDLWIIESVSTDTYKIKNADSGKYLQQVSDANSVNFTVGDGAVNYKITNVETVLYAFSTTEFPNRYMDRHSASQVATWGAIGNNAKWSITLVDDAVATKAASVAALQALVTKTESLVNSLATVTSTNIPGNEIALQADSESANYYILSSSSDPNEGGGVAALLDNDNDTYLHTNWHTVSETNDYLQVNIGSGDNLNLFRIVGVQRTDTGAQTDFPKKIEVQGSNNKTSWETITTLTGIPQTRGTSWERDVMSLRDYDYLRFVVTTGTDRIFFHLAEFSIFTLSPSTSAALLAEYAEYSSILQTSLITEAYEGVEIGNAWVNYTDATADEIDDYTAVLQEKYDALYDAYKLVIDAEKAELQALITSTNELVAQVGTATVSADGKVDLLGKLYAERPYSGTTNTGDVTTAENGYNLLDGNVSTYYHSDYEAATMVSPPYIRVDMGEGRSVTNFQFNYTTRNQSGCAPTTIQVVGGNYTNGVETYDEANLIATFTSSDTSNPLPTGTSAEWTSDEIASETAYRYIKFKVTASQGNNSGGIYFAISELGFNTIGVEEAEVFENYKELVSETLLLDTRRTVNDSETMCEYAAGYSVTVAQLKQQQAAQQAAYDALEVAMNQVNKDALETSLAAINALYSKMADGEGNIASDYTPSALTPEQLTAIKTVIDEAQAVFDYTGATQLEVNNAKTAVDEKYTELLTIEEANVNLSGTFDKSELETLITNAAALLSTINGKTENNSDYYAAAGIAIDELQDAYDAAVDAKDRYYLTQEQYAEVKDALSNSYTTINPIVVADVAGRDELTTLIDNVNTLVEKIAEDCAAKNVAVPLQSTESGDDFYIWCNSPANDSQGVAGLIDKNADGTANTGTFLGTSWGSAVAAYTHYIEVDLGEGITIDKLLFDYTTRNSTHANQRPTAIKILGSNDKTDYTEITIISEGLATEQCQQWSMAETLELGAPYRYIRFAIATQESTGFFNMSDFNLYALIGHTRALKEYYTTAEGLELDALCIALQSAEYAANHYLTTDRLTEVKEMLSGYYTTANTIVEADASDRTELAALATTTEELVTEVATFNTDEKVLVMQCTDETAPYYLYCNADGTTHTTYPNDAKGVAALLDDDATNHLHTTYEGAADDNLDHYLRLDMGENEAMMSFKFSYTGRNDGNNNDPTVMLIEGSNDLENFEFITKLTDLPTSPTPTTYSSGVLGNGKAYRYIRFMVTETKNNTKYQEHPYFVLSQFAVTACKTIEVSEDYVSPNLSLNTLVIANNEIVDANALLEEPTTYVLQSTYTNAITELQAAYDALEAATVADKTVLNSLIEATTLLKEQMYEIVATYTANEVTLQNTNASEAGYIYCNAPGTTNNYSGDNLGVAALLDNDTDTSNFLHTTYNGNNNEDGLDHYLRVYLGEAGTDYIEFRYTGRSGRAALTPKTAVIEATNDLNSEWVTIATLTNLAETTDEVSTGCLGNGTVYRYWRFMVTETNGGSEHDGHPYFALSAFNVYKCTDVVWSEQLKYTPNIYIYVTDDLVTEVTDAIGAAIIVKDDTEATQPAVNAAVEALQPIHDKLEEALKYAGVPVEITTDEENPILYNIIIKRADDGSKVLQYCEFDAENPNTVSVSAKATNSSYQAWYFMESTNGVTIKPFNGEGKVLGADNTSNGHTKVWAVTEGEKSYYEWKFIARTDGYYNIQAYDGSNYFSNMNGEGSKMGFWSDSPESDRGSLFKFVGAEFENDNARYYQLSNTLEYQTAATPEGTTVGAFIKGDAYSTAYTTASTLIEAGNTSAATDCYAAYTALRAASVDIEKIVPVAGKIYRIDITPTLDDPNRAGASMRIDDYGKLACGVNSAETADSHYYFTFEYDDDGNLYMKSLHTGTYLDEAHTTAIQLGADAETIDSAKKIAINTLGKAGDAVVVSIVPDGGHMLNCAAKEGDVVAYNSSGVNKASAWVITEVSDSEEIKYATTISSRYKYSTLMLNYNAVVPEGVTAYAAVSNDNSYVYLESVGDIIPAKTAVILEAGDELEDYNVAFKYTTDEVEEVEGNMLEGVLWKQLIDIDPTARKAYMLMARSGVLKLYRVFSEYASTDGVDDTPTYSGTDNGTHTVCPANRAYLPVDKTNNAAALSFRFDWGGTTDIDEISGNKSGALDGTIYDLHGRKLEKVNVPGFYIVNGKKVFVSEVE